MSNWAEQNNIYLGASLHWLRLRLFSVLATITPSPAPAHAPAPDPAPTMGALADPARRPWYGRQDAAPRVPKSTSAAPPVRASGAPDPGVLAEAATARTDAAHTEPRPALCQLAERLGLSDFERDTLLLCAAAEIDPGIANLYAQLQGSTRRSAPSFALALQVLEAPSWDALSPHRPLRYALLVELTSVAAATPLTTTPLRTDERVLHYIKGLNVIDERLAALTTPVGDGHPPLLSPQQMAVADAVHAQLRMAAAQSRLPLVQLVGPDAGSRLDLAREVSARLGRRVYRLGLDALPTAKGELEALVRLWLRERLLLPLTLYIDAEELQGAAPDVVAAFMALTSRDIGPAFVGLRDPPARGVAGVLSFEIERPSTREQHDQWLAVLASMDGQVLQTQAAALAPQLAGHFNLNFGDIARVIASSRTAMADVTEAALTADAIWQACRQLTQPGLDQLAQRLEPKAGWDDLVLPEDTAALLRQIAAQVRSRFQVYQDWGYGQRMTRGLGISALFAGESGTGKTMAAEVIARELGLSLYRIDLSAVVSKYIGETEKNLRRLFDSAEQGGAILFFDEADALFGKRSEVKDSHDRYANIEINYLLQRMEAFSGLAILATNMKSALDHAFMRRLRFIVNFPYPGPAERRRMWERTLPPEVPHEALDFDRLARLGLSGGNIHSIALNAAFMAAARGTPLTQAMLLSAARNEMRKLDKPVSEADLR